MDFDDMLEEIGEMGKFQITNYILVCLPVLFAGANSLTYVFTAGVPNYRCAVPGCDTENSSYLEHWLPWATPDRNDDDDDLTDTYRPAQCLRYARNRSAGGDDTCSEHSFTNDVEHCNEWIFDKERTIVNDWNVTCFENQWMLAFVGSSHFIGIIIGSAVFGVLADRFGRKYIFLLCILLMSVSGMAQVFSPGYVTFTLLVFVNAFGTSGVYPLAFVIGVEMVGRRKREVSGIVLNYFYAIGEALVALMAWSTQDWVWLQLSASAPPVLFGLYYWIIPESVRWLLAKRDNDRAKGIVCRAAEVNKELHKSGNDDDDSDRKNDKDNGMFPVIASMARSRKLVVRFVIVFCVWAINAFIFYGLSVNSTSVGGNKYVNFALVSLVEIPGYSLTWISIRKWGRRNSLIGSLLICGVTCTAAAFLDRSHLWGVIVLFLIGKMGVTAAFGIVYVHTAELLPTIVRSAGVGAASSSARIGSLLAPFVPLLGAYMKSLPMLLFGGFALTAAALALHLPETLGRKLPDSVRDAENL